MSKNVAKASQKGQDEARRDSVFDFLYHDSRRIGSFLSQFDNNGLLTGVSQGETATLNAKRGWKVGVGGDVPLLAGGKVEFEREPGESGSETFGRSYDPFWTNALTFLDFLEERQLICRDINKAAMGQFVLVKGSLSVFDLTIFKQAWGLKSIQLAIRASQVAAPVEGNRQQRRGQSRQPQSIQMPSDADIMLDLMTVLPHTVHASLVSDDFETIWASLRDEFLVTPSSEIVLTHGATLPDKWAMLGILNGRPDIGESETQQIVAEARGNFPVGLVNSAIGQVMHILAPIIRTTLGRPSNSYAITPILIFREVI